MQKSEISSLRLQMRFPQREERVRWVCWFFTASLKAALLYFRFTYLTEESGIK